jgi:hypothetical protein
VEAIELYAGEEVDGVEDSGAEEEYCHRDCLD